MITPKAKILVIDDEQGIRDFLAYELGRQGYTVLTAADGEKGVDKIREEKFDLVITDIKMPKMDGIQLLQAAKKIDPDLEIIMATGFGTIEMAVTAMKKGAYDFVQKPFNLEEILAIIEKALEKSELKTMLAVYESSKAVFAMSKLEDLLPVMIEVSKKIIPAEDVSVMLYNSDNSLSMAATTLNGNETKISARISMAEKVVKSLLPQKEPSILIYDSYFSEVRNNDDKIYSLLICPLHSKDRYYGLLMAARMTGRDPFNKSDLRHATILGSQISQAIANAKLYGELEAKIKELYDAYHELESTQSQLMHAEKMVAVGQMAAGIAHELNNPLTVVIGYTELLLESGQLPEGLKRDLEKVHHESVRCREIIKNLLLFARRQEPDIQDVNINELIDNVLDLLYHELVSDNINVVKEYTPQSTTVKGDANQLQQVLFNVLINAQQAMAGMSEKKININTSIVDGFVRAAITDNGCGITTDNISKIFDPFFTTKDPNNGTGLGLSISYGIVKQHNGRLYAQSEAGSGTSLIMELPLGDANLPAAK